VTTVAIGIDIGTPGARCVGGDKGGRVMAAAISWDPLLVPMLQCPEQHPGHWWQAPRLVLGEVYTELYRKTAPDMHRLSALAIQ
jgi:sugar (pentulose or hexulose) kinase